MSAGSPWFGRRRRRVVGGGAEASLGPPQGQGFCLEGAKRLLQKLPTHSFEIWMGPALGSVADTAGFVSSESCSQLGEGALYCKFPRSNYVLMYGNPPGPVAGQLVGCRLGCTGGRRSEGLSWGSRDQEWGERGVGPEGPRAWALWSSQT
jgi:hypothetical protein